jgi:hypothetical protein
MNELEIGRLTLKWEEKQSHGYAYIPRVEIYLADVLLGNVYEKENFCPIEPNEVPVDLIVPYKDLARAIEEAQRICG